MFAFIKNERKKNSFAFAPREQDSWIKVHTEWLVILFVQNSDSQIVRETIYLILALILWKMMKEIYLEKEFGSKSEGKLLWNAGEIQFLTKKMFPKHIFVNLAKTDFETIFIPHSFFLQD